MNHLTDLQQKVLKAFKTHGDMNDEKLVSLEELQHLAPSTVRSRRNELLSFGELVARREVKNRRNRWTFEYGIPNEK